MFFFKFSRNCSPVLCLLIWRQIASILSFALEVAIDLVNQWSNISLSLPLSRHCLFTSSHNVFFWWKCCVLSSSISFVIKPFSIRWDRHFERQFFWELLESLLHQIKCISKTYFVFFSVLILRILDKIWKCSLMKMQTNQQIQTKKNEFAYNFKWIEHY